MHITSSPERYRRWLKVIPGQECKNASVSRIAENSMLSRSRTGRYPDVSGVCTTRSILKQSGTTEPPSLYESVVFLFSL